MREANKKFNLTPRGFFENIFNLDQRQSVFVPLDAVSIIINVLRDDNQKMVINLVGGCVRARHSLNCAFHHQFFLLLLKVLIIGPIEVD